MKTKQLFTLAVAVLCSAFAMAQSSAEDSLKVDCGDQVTITAIPSEGYHFLRWQDGNTEPTRLVSATGNMTYRAYFEINQYPIVFRNWDLSVLDSMNWTYGALPSYTDTPTRPATVQYTYTFKGWDHEITPVDGADTYIAQYDSTLNIYTLTVTGVNGTVQGSGEYPYGTSVMISAKPNECYHFVNWSNGDTNANMTITITGPTSVEAFFEIDKFTITVVSDDATQGGVSITQ